MIGQKCRCSLQEFFALQYYYIVGVFNESRYWDIYAEYAKNTPNDILIQITIANRGPETARLHVLPTLWFRNTWIWGCKHEGCTLKASVKQTGPDSVECKHETLGNYLFVVDAGPNDELPELLFTENETNSLVGICSTSSIANRIKEMNDSLKCNLVKIRYLGHTLFFFVTVVVFLHAKTHFTVNNGAGKCLEWVGGQGVFWRLLKLEIDSNKFVIVAFENILMH